MPRMTKAFVALFDKYKVKDERRKILFKQVNDDYDKLLRIHSIEVGSIKALPFTDNKQHNQILILDHYFQNYNPEKEKERLNKMAARAQARNKYFDKFRETFGRNLRDFWDNNLLGFNSVKFDEEVVKSGDDESVHDAIRRQWGDAALYMIKQLMGSPDTPSSPETKRD